MVFTPVLLPTSWAASGHQPASMCWVRAWWNVHRLPFAFSRLTMAVRFSRDHWWGPSKLEGQLRVSLHGDGWTGKVENSSVLKFRLSKSGANRDKSKLLLQAPSCPRTRERAPNFQHFSLQPRHREVQMGGFRKACGNRGARGGNWRGFPGWLEVS